MSLIIAKTAEWARTKWDDIARFEEAVSEYSCLVRSQRATVQKNVEEVPRSSRDVEAEMRKFRKRHRKT